MALGDRFSLRSLFQRFSVPAVAPERTSGLPTSSNAASSFHLWLQVDPKPLVSFSATIEILDPPTVDRLYFWALQVTFVQGSKPVGAGHFGLQYYSKHPNFGAVNWGGYTHGGAGELRGTPSPLPSTAHNENTRDYQWHAGRRYRYEIARSSESAWRGTITDLTTGVETIVRELLVGADGVISPVVWTEAFARCDEPSVAIRWSDMAGVDTKGETVRPTRGRVNYQSVADGGCSNTTFESGPLGVVQRTSSPRLIGTGETIVLGG